MYPFGPTRVADDARVNVRSPVPSVGLIEYVLPFFIAAGM
jgi:hypothetical protein